MGKSEKRLIESAKRIENRIDWIANRPGAEFLQSWTRHELMLLVLMEDLNEIRAKQEADRNRLIQLVHEWLDYELP